jgi:hypothetical protein
LLVVGCHPTKYIHNLQLLDDGQYWAFYLRNKSQDSKDATSLEQVLVFKVKVAEIKKDNKKVNVL